MHIATNDPDAWKQERQQDRILDYCLQRYPLSVSTNDLICRQQQPQDQLAIRMLIGMLIASIGLLVTSRVLPSYQPAAHMALLATIFAGWSYSIGLLVSLAWRRATGLFRKEFQI